MEEGKKATVQEGFNVGFREGATAARTDAGGRR